MNNSNKYILSIVIPTRNRQEYAKQAINQVLNATSSLTQIVIQDNSDNQALSDFIKKLNTNRVLYHYSKEPLSFVDNFEYAVELAQGEYITLIGDDDGVLSNIESIVKWAIINNLDAVTARVLVTYYWPNSGAKHYNCSEDKGYININTFKSKYKYINSREILKKVIENGCQFYHNSGLPKLYHGLVRKKIVDSIIKKNGKIFSGLSPDIYSSFAISLYTEKAVLLDYPFTIDGNCKKSGAGAQAQGKHVGKLSDAPHFNGKKNYVWNPLVPKVYSIQTIWADSGLAALNDFKEDELLNSFNTAMISSYTMVNNLSIFKDTFNEFMRIKDSGKVNAVISLIGPMLKGPIPNIIKRILRRLIGFGKVGIIINNVENIQIAQDRIEKKIGCKRMEDIEKYDGF